MVSANAGGVGRPRTPADEVRWQLISFAVSQAICVAAELGLADLLASGAKSADDLAASCSANSDYLRRLLRFLASHGIFEEAGSGRFANSPKSAALRRDVFGSQHDYAILTRRQFYPAAAHLLHAVRTGSPAFDCCFEAPLFDYLAQHPDASDVFTQGMASAARLRMDLALSYDWPETGTIVDVGGADGAILTQVLAPRRGLTGVIFDRPDIEPSALQMIERERVTDRCRFVGGDFFDEVWAGGDVYFLSQIIHDWDDRRSGIILGNCRRAMGPGGRLLLLDHVLPNGSRPHPGFVIDAMMMIMTGGRERTEREWRDLLGDARFEIVAIQASDRMSLLEAVPIARQMGRGVKGVEHGV